jgi:hypothetical protein
VTALLDMIPNFHWSTWLPAALAGLALAVAVWRVRAGRSGRRNPAWLWLALALTPALLGGLIQLREMVLVPEGSGCAGFEWPLFAASCLAFVRAPNLIGLLSSGLLALAFLALIALLPPRGATAEQTVDRGVALALLTVSGVGVLALASVEMAGAAAWYAMISVPLVAQGTSPVDSGAVGQVLGIAAFSVAVLVAGRIVLRLRGAAGGGGLAARLVAPLLLLVLVAAVQFGARVAIEPLYDHTLSGRLRGLEVDLAALPSSVATGHEAQLELTPYLLRPGAAGWEELRPDGQVVTWSALPKHFEERSGEGFTDAPPPPPDSITILAAASAPASTLLPTVQEGAGRDAPWRTGNLLARQGEPSTAGHLLSTIPLDLGVSDPTRELDGPGLLEFYAETTFWGGMFAGSYSLVVPGVLLVDRPDGISLYGIPQVPRSEVDGNETSLSHHTPLPPAELMEILEHGEGAGHATRPPDLLASTQRALARRRAGWLHIVPGHRLSVQDVWTLCAAASVASPSAPMWVQYEDNTSGDEAPEAVHHSCRIWPALPDELTFLEPADGPSGSVPQAPGPGEPAE